MGGTCCWWLCCVIRFSAVVGGVGADSRKNFGQNFACVVTGTSGFRLFAHKNIPFVACDFCRHIFLVWIELKRRSRA